MRALVTGGHGFIGSHLVRRLLADGVEVRCLSRRAGRPAALAGLDVEVVPGDVRRPEGLVRALRGVDEVYHLAGLTSSLSRAAMFATNAGGTSRVLRAARAAGVGGRFVYCSSLATVGPAPRGVPHDEAVPPAPITWYGQSKRAAEEAALAMREELPLTIVRPPAVYGPRDEAFLTLFQAAARGLALLPGDPTRSYSLIHAADLAAALVAAAGAPATLGGVFFAAHPRVVTLLEVVEAAERAVGRRTLRLALPDSFLRLVGRVVDLFSQWTGRPSVLGTQRMKEVSRGDWTCSPAALEGATGWRAERGLAEGFAETAAWYREHGLLR
jgi:nucleoside-diphosphate-sugar epimerase